MLCRSEKNNSSTDDSPKRQLDDKNMWQEYTPNIILILNSLKEISQDFTIGTVDKNLPANAGDMGSMCGLGRFHMLWSSRSWEPRLLRPVHPEPTLPKTSHCCEESICRNCKLPPLATTGESWHTATKTQHSQEQINQQKHSVQHRGPKLVWFYKLNVSMSDQDWLEHASCSQT